MEKLWIQKAFSGHEEYFSESVSSYRDILCFVKDCVFCEFCNVGLNCVHFCKLSHAHFKLYNNLKKASLLPKNWTRHDDDDDGKTLIQSKFPLAAAATTRKQNAAGCT